MIFRTILLLFLLTSCQSYKSVGRSPSSIDSESCSKLGKGIVNHLRKNSIPKSIDENFSEAFTPTLFESFIAYARTTEQNGHQLIVKRTSDGKAVFEANLDSKAKAGTIHYDSSVGRLIIIRNGKVIQKIRGFRIKPIERTPVSYNEVLAQMEKGRYEKDDLPTIPLQMFRFFKKGLMDFFVGRRSKEILTKGADFREVGQNKPIHPMGVGVKGRIHFKETKYSGLFSGGDFPILGRFSISQGNPVKKKQRTWLQRLMGKPASDENRSVAAALKVFPTENPNEKVVTANAVFQNDLNGELLENYIDGVMTNQPQLNFLKIRKSYEIFTLLGVAKGALSNPNDLKKSFPYINPQVRPLHQFAEMGVSDPADVVVPTWIKIQAVDGQEIKKADDFRNELDETISQDGLRYQIFLSDSVDEQGEIIWEEAGEITLEESILSEGVDKNLLFYHDALRSPFSGEMIDPDVVPKPTRTKN